MCRLRTLLLAAMLAVAMLVAGNSPAAAQEWIQHPMTGAWVWCEYDAYGTYWCYWENGGIWTMAKPGWQYGPLGG